MTKRIGGARRKTRYKFKKPVRKQGKLSLTKYFQTFDVEERVILLAEPAVQKGMYHRRFHGKSGIITGKRGNCYKITIKDQSKVKEVIVHPVHLKKV
ncbi:50S ribosomal protein L21e [Candidatus Woesearchaeota archaeon]|jgi:large subunit ribosomal protein L21e|nr:50S ribosomal protein L21e [Candidatus Woesearchaeota archaeon]MBT5272100.1 50S ribosomal protein L21e [Candidatus Woesearchaeota archaeon]MBT6041850.1 50S ribosomal protein L21e [Candidatus Woesearchaeota archaeon]MBT6336169.1 50S ribosomal protein L21e [Candidatus Woesearchaeota archaeon]MBT7928278.1 50S ribosomal protein L21e [Candidatus Woesearchaeota archaeon]